jgi:hypothetical protein
MGSEYTFRWVEDESGFDDLAGSWDELVGEESTPFDTHRWYRAWWAAFGSPGGVAIATAWQGDRLAAVFPLRRHREGRLAAMANEHTPLYRPVGRDPAATTALVRHVLSGDEASVELFAVPETDPVVGSASESTRDLSRYEVVEQQNVSPIVETVGTFEAWRKLTKPNWHSNIPRLARKLQREHDAEFSIVEVPTDLNGELDMGFRVEASGWKGEQQTAIQSAPQTEAFYRNVARAFHDRGQLRLSRIVVTDGCAAFDFTGTRPATRDDRTVLRARAHGARTPRERRGVETEVRHRRPLPHRPQVLPAQAAAICAVALPLSRTAAAGIRPSPHPSPRVARMAPRGEESPLRLPFARFRLGRAMPRAESTVRGRPRSET